jgi:hypothetical protein
MGDISVSLDQVRNYIVLINIILGFLFGTFPLVSGIKMNNRKFGVFGFVGSIIGGAILGVFLSYPIAAVFTWLILKKSFAKDDVDSALDNENLVKVETDNTENL